VNQELFQPSLKADVDYVTKSYNLNHFLLVSLIGGFFPAILLGMKNARWLRVRPLWSYTVATVGGVLWFAVGYTGYGRFLAVFVGIAYYFLMREMYTYHLGLYGRKQPILLKAILYTIIGRVIEGYVLIKGVQFFYGNG